jgi:penicillin-binding protein-related factor A (putative recombinase)
MTPEGLIKKDICDYLRARGVFFWMQQAGKIPGRKNSSKNSRNGVSDILGSYKGRLMAIEVKTKTGRVSTEQTEFLELVNRTGGIGFVARSVEDVQKGLL